MTRCHGCGCMTDEPDVSCNLCTAPGCGGCVDDGLHAECRDILRERDDLPRIGAGR